MSRISGNSGISGISVSVESYPRSPPVVGPLSGNIGSLGHGLGLGLGLGLGAPLKKRIQDPRRRETYSIMLGRELTDREEEAYAIIEERHTAEDAAAEEESISPRVLFMSSRLNWDVARRLDFSSEELSPIPLVVSSSSSPVADSAVVPEAPEVAYVGECGVCYAFLPVRSNHVFTVCGHLFCVKCILTWWESSTKCPMCRAEIMNFDAVDAAPAVEVPAAVAVAAVGAAAAVVIAADSMWMYDTDGSDELEYDSDDSAASAADVAADVAAAWAAVDAIFLRRRINVIDRYLYADEGIEWATENTDPEYDDQVIQLTNNECLNLRWSRAIATNLWARFRFIETLFSDIDFLGGVFHEFIPRTQWLGFSHYDMGPSRMFEFVMSRATAYNAPVETNFFGYISQIVITRVENARTAYNDEEWGNNHEYAFIVQVFCPTAPFGYYNTEEGVFEPAELLFRFSDIRRMYSLNSMERGSA